MCKIQNDLVDFPADQYMTGGEHRTRGADRMRQVYRYTTRECNKQPFFPLTILQWYDTALEVFNATMDNRTEVFNAMMDNRTAGHNAFWL